ncbi:MAG: permease-like cell division protein FtsX [Firmicutes bacterium]|nr:permease-like cell division protein FtsX [Bacillota bacterium]
MKLRSFRYVGPQAFKSMGHNGWLTVAAILTITISLFLCAMFWLILINLDANVSSVENDLSIMVYLDDSVQEDRDFKRVETALHNIDGVDQVTLVTKDEGLASLSDRFGGADLEETLGGDNPLPDMFNVTALDADAIADIAGEIETIAGVGTVRYGEGTVEKLVALTNTLRKVGLAVMLMLAAGALVLIALSIRLAILGRRKEIMVMKWVGATNTFIRWPFFLEGLLLGLIGAVLALALCLLLYTRATDYLHNAISFIQVLPLQQVWLQTGVFVLAAGLILGALGALLPLSRFLDV